MSGPQPSFSPLRTCHSLIMPFILASDAHSSGTTKNSGRVLSAHLTHLVTMLHILHLAFYAAHTLYAYLWARCRCVHMQINSVTGGQSGGSLLWGITHRATSVFNHAYHCKWKKSARTETYGRTSELDMHRLVRGELCQTGNNVPPSTAQHSTGQLEENILLNKSICVCTS